MKKVLIAIMLVLLLIACESKTTGKRVAIPELSTENSISGAVVTQTQTSETGKTAAETLKNLQENPIPTTETGAKSGNFYPPVTSSATGKDALKEKTRALFQKEVYTPTVDADDEFGAKYHDNDGDATNLPGDYDDSNGD